MAEWLGNGLQNHAQQFDSAWHLHLLVISFSVINYVVSMRGPHVSGDNLFFLCPVSSFYFHVSEFIHIFVVE